MKSKKILCLSIAATMLAAAALAGCGGKETDPAQPTPPEPTTPTTPTWTNAGIWLDKSPIKPDAAVELPTEGILTNVMVHDPSVFYDPWDGIYYAFGSHYAVASSNDLLVWEQEVRDEGFTELYGDETITYNGVRWPKALEATVELVAPQSSIKTTWAPDVELIGDKYYMYYSLTKAFGSNESAIGRVEADHPLGPYTNNVILIDSVGANSATDPNCIDPELFYDEDGKLWMVYGSFMGGIYIKELYTEGDKVGLPKEEGFGKLLWKNGHAAGVEGPFIFYNATNDYYYLMVSEGDLNTVYNMRIARSKNPNGPYTDVTGKDVAADGEGNKIAGNFNFSHASSRTGYAAMGHNSVIKTEDGRYMVVYHTRRETGTDVTPGHNVQVSQLYFNKDGWPVMSPAAYVGETFGTVTEAQLTANFDVLLHAVGNDVAMATSTQYAFTADGKITLGGAEKGTWTLEEGFYVTIVLDGVTYKGVVAPIWDMYSESNGAVPGITAVSDAGRSLWAIAVK